jgi:NADPH:quinone reductase-like Zn-dependent oxidoreductase
MRAVIAEAVGESQRLVQVSTPRPRAGEVLIRVHPITTLLSQVGVPADAAASLEPAQRLLSSVISP